MTRQRPERRLPSKPAAKRPACGPGGRPERRPPFKTVSKALACGRSRRALFDFRQPSLSLPLPSTSLGGLDCDRSVLGPSLRSAQRPFGAGGDRPARFAAAPWVLRQETRLLWIRLGRERVGLARERRAGNNVWGRGRRWRAPTTAPVRWCDTHWHCAHLHRTCVLCKCGGRAAPVQVCPERGVGVRSACTVPHTVPVSYREAHVGRYVLREGFAARTAPGGRTPHGVFLGKCALEVPPRPRRRFGARWRAPAPDNEPCASACSVRGARADPRQ